MAEDTAQTEILLELEAVRKNWFRPVLQSAGNHWERICQECSFPASWNAPPPHAGARMLLTADSG